MSDNDDTNPGGNVINFASRTGHTGFNLTPVGPGGPGDPLGPVIAPPAAPAPGNGTGGTHQRRSPLQHLNQLPSPTLTALPVVATGNGQGGLPDTFRGPGRNPDRIGPRMGALSLAAILAVSVAALRGACIVLQDWRQRRMERAAENAPLREARAKHKLALAQAGFASTEAAAKNHAAAGQASAKHAQTMRGIGDKSAEQRAKDNGKKNKVPSSAEFGRKTAGGSGAKGGGAGGKGAGVGPGRSGKGPQSGKGGAAGLGNGGTKKTDAKGRDLKQNNARKDLAGLKKPVGPKTPDKPKSPMRTSQGAGSELKKKLRPGPQEKGKGRDLKQQPGKGNDRTRLPRALKDTAHKVADARLDKRRKNLDKPAAWKNDPKAAPKTAGPDPKKKRVDLTKNPNKVPSGRTKLWDAFKNDTQRAAKDRWNKRGGNHGTPPLWKNNKSRQKKNTKSAGPNPKAAGSGPAAPQGGKNAGGAQKPSTGPRNTHGAGRRTAWWAKARAQARRKANNGGCFPGGTPKGSTAGQGTQGANRGRQGAQPGPHGHVPHGGTGPGFNTNSGSGPRNTGGRRSPFENAGQAQPTTYTVEREDHVGAQAKTWQPDGIGQGQQALPAEGPLTLPAAPEPHAKRPGTSRPKEAHPMPPAAPMPVDPRITKARTQAARRGDAVIRQAKHMDARHATEITLDDALDEYGAFKDDAFKTHAACSKLSGRARKLRDTLEVFSEVLAAENNLIGVLFSGAMANLSESMDLVARMGDEMEISSLEAAEMSESADNDLNDAYRPITQATADAGLTTPSAPVHNQS